MKRTLTLSLCAVLLLHPLITHAGDSPPLAPTKQWTLWDKLSLGVCGALLGIATVAAITHASHLISLRRKSPKKARVEAKVFVELINRHYQNMFLFAKVQTLLDEEQRHTQLRTFIHTYFIYQEELNDSFDRVGTEFKYFADDYKKVGRPFVYFEKQFTNFLGWITYYKKKLSKENDLALLEKLDLAKDEISNVLKMIHDSWDYELEQQLYDREHQSNAPVVVFMPR